MKNVRTLVAAASVGAFLKMTATAPDYPQWRGVNRDGSASGFTEPKEWPESLTFVWKVDVGEGYATALIVGTSVYTFTRLGGDR